MTAADSAVPRRSLAGPLTLIDCARAFVRQPSPKLIAGAIVAALAARVALGDWSWRDLVLPAALVAFEPVTEWLIHVYLLHARPVRIGRRSFELPTTREHVAHHAAPAELDGVLIPSYGIAIFVPMIALTLWLLSFPIHLVLGGDRLAVAASGLVVSFVILGTYEWLHFLIHTPYRPRARYYRSIWRSHRLHHYKNEHYWFGVTSNLGDRALRTFPDQATVSKSPTARSLGAEPSS